MKEPLDELLVQACAAQQRADLAALEQLEPCLLYTSRNDTFFMVSPFLLSASIK